LSMYEIFSEYRNEISCSKLFGIEHAYSVFCGIHFSSPQDGSHNLRVTIPAENRTKHKSTIRERDVLSFLHPRCPMYGIVAFI
jgi:hypothetical protein